MRLDQLRYLRDINQTNSISKTASRFFVSPQALSKSMQQLEAEIGATVLVRSPFGVTLTPQGELFLNKMSPFIDQYDALHEEFLSSTEGEGDSDAPETIHICISSVLASLLLPQAIANFHSKHPRTRITVEEVEYNEIFPALSEGKCDLALLTVNDEYFYKEWNDAGEKDFHYNLLLSDRLVGCVSSSSPLAKKETITHKDLKVHGWTALNIVYRQKAYEVMERYVKRYGKASGNANALYSGSNVAFHHEAMRELGVITLMPRSVFQKAFNPKHFTVKYLEESPSGVIYHTAIYPTSHPHAHLLELTNSLQSIV